MLSLATAIWYANKFNMLMKKIKNHLAETLCGLSSRCEWSSSMYWDKLSPRRDVVDSSWRPFAFIWPALRQVSRLPRLHWRPSGKWTFITRRARDRDGAPRVPLGSFGGESYTRARVPEIRDSVRRDLCDTRQVATRGKEIYAIRSGEDFAPQ